jgi:hypothetical protein
MLTPSVSELKRGSCHARGQVIVLRDHLIARSTAPHAPEAEETPPNLVCLSDRRARELAVHRIAGVPAPSAALAEPA